MLTDQQKNTTYIQTVSGKPFYVFDPILEDIDIKDIAHSLSLINRFNGHTFQPYSVASHSLLLSYVVPETYALEALLHDAAEAYLGDIVRPMKILDVFSFYREAEAGLEFCLAKRFGLRHPIPQEVVVADRRMCRTEKDYFFKSAQIPWPGIDELEPYDLAIFDKLHGCIANPWEIRKMFLSRFDEVKR